MNASSDTDRLLGEICADIRTMKETQSKQADDLREVRDTVLKAKSGWKTLIAIGAISGSAGALFAKLAPFLAMPK